jgi:hypothetical protein
MTDEYQILKTELIDIKALKWAIKNYNSIELNRPADQSLDSIEYKKYNTNDIMKKLLNKCKINGHLQTEYKQQGQKNRGRYYVKNGLGLQSLMREFRSLLCRNNYYDIDIVNSDPTILHQFCEKNLPDIDITNLKNYVNNRDILLNELMTKNEINRDQAKQIILMISHGGNSGYDRLKEKPDWIKNLRNEFENIGKGMMNKYTDDKKYCQMKKPKPHCVWGSLSSLLTQDIESNIINQLDKYLTEKGYSVDTLIFDGALVRNNKAINQEILDDASEFIDQQTGYKVKFISKPFDETIKLPDNILTSDEEYYEIKKRFEKDVVKITTPVQFLNLKKFNAVHDFANNEDHEVDYMTKKNLIEAYEDYDEWKGTTIVQGKTPKIFIENWIRDPAKASYERVDFIPHPLKCSSNIFNTFRGFDIETVTDVEENQQFVTLFRNHISYLVDNDKKSSEYVEKYFAQLIQEPGKIPRTAMLFKSKEGYGKNMMLDVIASIIGHKYYVSTPNPKDVLYSKFNSQKSYKLLINIDETEQKETEAFYEKLKADITNPTTQIEKKGFDIFTVKNFARYIFTTNNESSIRVSKTDRRFAMFECTGKKKNAEYFNKLNELKENKNAIYSIYKYLKSVDIQGFDFEKNRPITAIYKRHMQNSISNIYEYMQNLAENEMDENENIVIDGSNISYNAPQLYKDYIQFCINNKYIDRMERKTFDNTLTTILSRSRNKKGYCWKFTQQYIKEYLISNEYWDEPECLIDSDEDDNDEEEMVCC